MMMSLAEEESQDPDWVQKLRSQGGVPMQSPDDCGGTGTGSGWASPPGYNFMVRGPTYFSTKSKIPAAPSLLKPLAFDWIKSSSKIHEILRNPSGRVNAALASRPDPKGGAFVWAFNLQVPSKENYSAIAYFVSMDPIPEGSLMAQFIDGDDAFRAARLKLIANIVHGPWIVRTAVGEQAICILGRAVSCRFHRGPNFMEVDVDIGASMLANAVVHLALGYVTSITVDLAFLIEAQSEEELPEKLLGTVRFANLDPASALSIDHADQLKEDELKGEGEGEEEEDDDEKGSDSGYESFEDTIVEPAPPVASSMTTRLWRSLSTYINGEEDSSKNAGPRREQSSSSLFSDAEEEN